MRPLVSVPLAAKELKVSPQAIEGMLKELGTVRELTGRGRSGVGNHLSQDSVLEPVRGSDPLAGSFSLGTRPLWLRSRGQEPPGGAKKPMIRRGRVSHR